MINTKKMEFKNNSINEVKSNHKTGVSSVMY